MILVKLSLLRLVSLSWLLSLLSAMVAIRTTLDGLYNNNNNNSRSNSNNSNSNNYNMIQTIMPLQAEAGQHLRDQDNGRRFH